MIQSLYFKSFSYFFFFFWLISEDASAMNMFFDNGSKKQGKEYNYFSKDSGAKGCNNSFALIKYRIKV